MRAFTGNMSNFDINSMSIDEIKNRVIIRVNNGWNIEQVIAHLQERDLYETEAINFIVEPGGRTRDLAYRPFREHRRLFIGIAIAGSIIFCFFICIKIYLKKRRAK